MVTFTRRELAPLAFLAATGAAAPSLAAAAPEVERWGLHELVLEGPRGGNPFLDVTFGAEFRHADVQVQAPGFYDGAGQYRVRFSPDRVGEWTWVTTSSVPTLRGRTGRFRVAPARAGNHGPVRARGFHFAHADGTPFRPLGTTAYAWAQQSDARCAETLATLASSPFNKIRMCVFPNVAAEPIWPFGKTGPGDRDWEYDRFNPTFFRRFEDRIAKLLALGVQADVILFHPYDEKRGFSGMSRTRDERYIRYLSARLSAFRNVWWSLANEFDLVKGKTVGDFDHLFRVLQAADPHGRLRSIHNWRELYDNGKPWVTHSSIQNGSAVLDDARAEIFRSVWRKPVIFDEVRYEGDIDQRWGDLRPQELVARFWHGLVAGTYVGHGETYKPEGAGADGSWLGKGGRLRGSSAPRLAFLKAVMEAGPVPGVDPIDKWWDQHLGGQAGQYYLRYFGDAAPRVWGLDLPRDALEGGERFRVDVLDTWNMTISAVPGAFTMRRKNAYFFHDPARPVVDLPGRPAMAIRVVRLP